MKNFCPELYSNGVRLFSVMLIAAGFLFVNTSHSFAQEIGTNVESRTEFPGTAAIIGAQSEENAAVTGVIQIDWAVTPGRAQQIVDELNANFGKVVIRVSGKKVGESFTAMTTAQAAQIGQTLSGVTGIYAVEFGNEVNNIGNEWAGGDIPSYIAAYNAFATAINNSQRIGPAALDTFFARDAYETARQIRGGITDVDVLFFNSYESRSEDVWSTNNGCSLPDAQQRLTGCSWRGLANAYGGASELILTEFSLKPTDNDTDLTQVLRYISTVGPTMGTPTIITPLVRDVCGAGKTGWLYLIQRTSEPSVNGLGLVTEAGDIVDPASCAKTPGTGGPNIPGIIINSILNILNFLVKLAPNLVSQGCDPLGDIIIEYEEGTIRVDRTGRSYGVPCLNELENLTVNHVNECNIYTVSDVVTVTEENPQPTEWVQQDFANSKYSSKLENGEDKVNIFPRLDNSVEADKIVNSGLELEQELWILQNKYLGGPLADSEIAKRARANVPKHEQLRWAGVVPKVMPHMLPGSDVDWRTESKNKFVDHALAGIGWSLKTNSKYGYVDEAGNPTGLNGAGAIALVVPDIEAGHDTVACFETSDGWRISDNTEDESAFPIRMSYFACRDESFPLTFLSQTQKDTVCEALYGPSFVQTGKITPTSWYGQFMTAEQRTYPIPGEDMLFQDDIPNGDLSCWSLLVVPNDERGTKVETTILSESWDPSDPFPEQKINEKVYSEGIRRGKFLYDNLANVMLPYETQKRVDEQIRELRTDTQCLNEPFDVINKENPLFNFGDVNVRSKLDPTAKFQGLYCPSGNCNADDSTPAALGVATALAQAKPVVLDPGDGVTDPVQVAPPKPPPVEQVSDSRRVKVKYTYPYSKKVEDEKAKTVFKSLLPYPYNLKYDEKISGTNIELGDAFCVGNQELASDIDNKRDDMPFPGCGKMWMLGDVQCTAQPWPLSERCRELQGGSLSIGGSVPQSTDLTYSIPFRNTQCQPTQSIIDDVADRMAGTGIYDPVNGGLGAYYAGGTGIAGAQNLRDQWTAVIAEATRLGINPLFALTLWIEESSAGGFTQSYGMGCINPRNDASAVMLKGASPVATMQQTQCVDTYIDAVNRPEFTPTFRAFMCRYSGEPGRDPDTEECSTFTTNPNFPNGVEFWYDILSAGQPASCLMTPDG